MRFRGNYQNRSRWNVTNPQLRQSHSIWTAQDVVTFLRISKSEVYRMAKRGALPCFRVGGQMRFLANEILRWSTESSEKKRPAQTAGIEAIVAHTFEQRPPKERP
jgi:excisionase family DNA binding protein